MGLQIWLPLNGSLKNQGLYEVLPTGSTITMNNNGKIGQCLQTTSIVSLNAPQSIYDVYSVTGTEITYSFWVKIDKDYLNQLISTADFSTKTQIYNKIIGLPNGTTSNGIGIHLRTDSGLTNSTVLDQIYIYSYLRNGSYNGGSSAQLINLDQWYHLAISYNKNNLLKFYINGVLIDSRTVNRANINSTISEKDIRLNINVCQLGNSQSSSVHLMTLKEYFNDLRVYDHALSDKEVEEISKGLVLHYKLDKNINVLNNCYNYPTFNTSNANGGWSHWGPSGHAGTYSQNTDKQFIYNKNNTYSHCVDNTASGTGKYYLCYQSPAFDGGYRSLQCIIKEANGLPITEMICNPGWNARNGGAPASIWTDISALGDGFYLCKVNGLSQDGSNNLVSITVQPGYKIYISEAYLENNKQICSDIFFQNDLSIIYDSSGYQNNGVLNDTSAISEFDSSRYTKYIKNNQANNSATYLLKGNVNVPESNALTFAWWMYPTQIGSQTSGLFSTSSLDLPTDYNVTAANMRDSCFDCCNTSGTCVRIDVASSIVLNEWHHYALVYSGTQLLFYKDGVQVKTANQTGNLKSFTSIFPFYSKAGGVNRNTSGGISDFRIYVTALSVNQIKELYNTSATIDNLGNVYAREVIE